MKILFDQNVPWKLRKPLSQHVVMPSHRLGWAQLRNGELLATAERAGYEVFVTGDRNIRYQQNLGDRAIAIVELPTTQWPELKAFVSPVVDAVNASTPRFYIVVPYDGSQAVQFAASERKG